MTIMKQHEKKITVNPGVVVPIDIGVEGWLELDIVLIVH